MHRRVGDPPLSISWPSGMLANRAEVPIVTAVAPTARWWSVRLEPITQEWGGQAYGGSTIAQTASTWAQIRFADPESSPLYVTWPVLGGTLHLFGQQISVTALPLLSGAGAYNPAADGPSWGCTIEDEPLSRTGRPDWCGLQLTADGGDILIAGDAFAWILPPYTRAVQVRQNNPTGSITAAVMALPIEVEVLGPTALTLGAQRVIGGGRVEVGPRAQIVSLINTDGAQDLQVHLFAEVMP